MPRLRAALALLATTALATGCITATLSPANDAIPGAALDSDGFLPVVASGFVFEEIDLGTVDGVRLHADVYLPDPEKPIAGGAVPEKLPTILVLSPYWGGGTGGTGTIGYMPYDFLIERLLPRGYAVVFGDLAGSGGSGGCWDFMGPVERTAAVAMVEAIAAQPWSDGKVGMMGLSYDAMTQVMAASDAAPHLVTVVPAAALTSAYAGLIQNGVHYAFGWHATAGIYETSSLTPPGIGPFGLGPNPGRLAGWAERLGASPACVAENHSGYGPTNAYTDYFAERDYRALGENVRASVFAIQGFEDAAVKPDNFGAWFEGVPTLKKAWLGYWYHEYPTAANGGRDDMYLTLHRWFDHTLKGADNGIDREPAIDVQDGLGRWRHEAAWPPADARPTTFALGADGALAPAGAAVESGDVTFGGPFAARDLLGGGESGAASFESASFATGLHVSGRPALSLTLASDRPAGQVVAYLLNGDRLVSRGAFNLLYAGGLEEPRPLPRGEPVTVAFELYPTDYVVPPGEALRLVLVTQDGGLWYDPDASGAVLTLEAGEAATLTLPVVTGRDDDVFLVSCGESLKDALDGCWLDLEDKGVEGR